MSSEETDRLFFIKGVSMSPVLQTGDRVEVVSVTRQEVRKGDILTFFNAEGHRVIHRVIRLHPLQTRGDNCDTADSLVPNASPLLKAVSCRRGKKHWRLTGGSRGVLQFFWNQWRRCVVQMAKAVLFRLARWSPFRLSASRLTPALFPNRTVYYLGRRPVGWRDQEGWHWLGWAQFYVKQPKATGRL